MTLTMRDDMHLIDNGIVAWGLCLLHVLVAGSCVLMLALEIHMVRWRSLHSPAAHIILSCFALFCGNALRAVRFDPNTITCDQGGTPWCLLTETTLNLIRANMCAMGSWKLSKAGRIFSSCTAAQNVLTATNHLWPYGYGLPRYDLSDYGISMQVLTLATLFIAMIYGLQVPTPRHHQHHHTRATHAPRCTEVLDVESNSARVLPV